MSRAVVIAPTATQPRFHKRVQALLRQGVDVDVYVYGRGYYRINSFPDACKVTVLPTAFADGEYHRRALGLFTALQVVRAGEAKLPEPKLVYSFGLDNAFLAAMAFPRRVPIVYEIGDIRAVQLGNSFVSKGIRWLESTVLRRAGLVVVTATAYKEQYLKGFGSALPPVLVVENRLPRVLLQMAPRPVTTALGQAEPLRLGVVGYLRYPRATQALLDAVRQTKRPVSLHVFGEGPEYPRYQAAQVAGLNLDLWGPFRNPEGLAEVYRSLDLNIALYENEDLNVQWAIPNKLYESTYFGVPIVAASGTEFARRVLDWKVGYKADPARPESIRELLEGLHPEQLRERSETALQIPTEQIVEDSAPLEDALRQLMRK